MTGQMTFLVDFNGTKCTLSLFQKMHFSAFTKTKINITVIYLEKGCVFKLTPSGIYSLYFVVIFKQQYALLALSSMHQN